MKYGIYINNNPVACLVCKYTIYCWLGQESIQPISGYQATDEKYSDSEYFFQYFKLRKNVRHK